MFISLLLVSSQITVVSAASSTPVLEVIGDRSVNENSLLTFTLSAHDSDGDSLVFSASGLPTGSNLDNSTGLFQWAPTYNQSGSYLTQFVVSDGSYIDSEYITIVVNNVNRLPVFSSIADTTVYENELLSLVLEASDPDDDLLVFSKNVEFGVLQDNVFTWVPDYDAQGDHIITFTVNDGSSSVTQTVRITVLNVNRNPVLFSISDTSVLQKEPVTIQLNGFDEDGDILTYSCISSLPNGASFDTTTGLFQWTNTDTSGIYFIVFGVNDSFTLKTKTAMIVVGDSNSPPVINSVGPKSVDENSELSFEISAYDTNIGDKLSFSCDLTGASLKVNGSSAQFTWTPSYEQAGKYKVEFKVSDGSSYDYADYEVIDIVVNDVNRAPAIYPVSDSSLNEKSVLYINMSANDPDGDTLTFLTNSSFGTVRGNTFICSPGYSDAGVHDVLFTVSDGSLSNSTTATITVIDVNMPPKINSISPLEVIENKTLEFRLSVSDDDTAEVLTYAALDLPSGAIFNSSSALFKWTPSSTQLGTHSVSFHVNDGELFDYETISITVTKPSSSDSSSSSSSGGGGGGSQSTGEKYENIEVKDYSIKSVMKDMRTTFVFDDPANNIVSIDFVSRLNGGQTKAVVELLRGTSTLVKIAPVGDVYKNLNIWVGDSKFPSDMIYNVVIDFKVEKSWIYLDGRDSELVQLYRYSDGMWNPLETSIMDEDEDYFYYEAKSPGFSPFAIIIPDTSEIAIMENEFYNETKMSIGDELLPLEGTDVSQSNKKSLFLLLLIGLIVAVAVVGTNYKSRYEKIYMQIGNPDGKRYRRIKK
ncbi:PGF-pre-PGF domain-containing protein [Methanolobus psychrotolerans]|uniref:PGF-pre-PGF domain-containing protein n=1 Tax=Methanolobus psychrotolerans TaxID=1874706 RepID=UPI0013EB2FD2|nr:PGF-pre-PGF domain-containing protein [Methanolobus psychrotolerans]